MGRRGGIGVNKNGKREEWDMERRKRESFVQMKKPESFVSKISAFFYYGSLKTNQGSLFPAAA